MSLDDSRYELLSVAIVAVNDLSPSCFLVGEASVISWTTRMTCISLSHKLRGEASMSNTLSCVARSTSLGSIDVVVSGTAELLILLKLLMSHTTLPRHFVFRLLFSFPF